MERSRRVYPAQRSLNGWLSGLLLFLSAVVILSGLVWRGEDKGISIQLASSPTPSPLNETFDETPAQREVTLPGGEWYALQLGAFEQEEAAGKLGEQYALRGAAGYVWHDGRYRTLAAVYPLKEDAQQVRRQLSEKHDVECYLYTISMSALQIRIKGMQGQIEILEASFLHAEEIIRCLYRLSSELDRQEKTASEVVEELKGIGDQASAVLLRLRQRFDPGRNEAVSGMVCFFETYLSFVSSLSEEMSAVGTGAKLKYQTLEALHCLWQVYDSISNT